MYRRFIVLSFSFILTFSLAYKLNTRMVGSSLSTPLSFQPTYTLKPTKNIVFAALPPINNDIKTSVKTADARPEIIRQYLSYYNSPLEPHSDLIVQLADKYDFDYRWLVAIAQQESNLCKHIPENSYNCWGWGIYPNPVTGVLQVIRFDDYADALTSIAPRFKELFLHGKHYRDAYKVMKTYTPPSDGSWAHGVLQFFKDLE